jgi:hypothetical protein
MDNKSYAQRVCVLRLPRPYRAIIYVDFEYQSTLFLACGHGKKERARTAFCTASGFRALPAIACKSGESFFNC